MPKQKTKRSPNVNPKLNPMAVAMMSSAYWNSCVLHAAQKFDVFNQIGTGKVTAQQLAEKCSADPRGMDILLIACTSLGLLERKGPVRGSAARGSGRGGIGGATAPHGPPQMNAYYQNSPLAKTFLVKGSPYYQGGIVSMFEEWYPTWGRLYNAVRTGKPVVEKPHDQGEEAVRIYIMGMHYRGVAQAKLLSQKISLKGRRRLLDVAGGPGTFSIMMCLKNKGLQAVVLDLPQTLRITREIIQSFHVPDRVLTQEGNYLLDEIFGKGYDAVLLSSMFNQESPTVIKNIMRKSLAALNPGGLVIVQEQLLNDEKSGPALAALIGVNQLLHTPGGAAYSGEEMGEWMEEVGFVKVQRVPMPSPSPFTVLKGVKP
ncbi:MAG: acetylserotonin O-methyltransferase [Nitrospira sp.]|nr:acetylserotonin O-methyltransferase [Nitrospira sp.]